MSRKVMIPGLALLLLAAGLLAVGCSQNGTKSAAPTSTSNTPGTSAAQGSVVVGLQARGATLTTDGSMGRRHLPDSGIAQLFITFDSIRLYPMADSTEVVPDPVSGRHHGPCPADSGNFIEILTQPVTVDVVALADSLSTLMTNANVPAGTYSHLTLHLANAWAFTDSGAQVSVALVRPDSLLGIHSKFTVADGQATTITITIDLDHSVREVPPGSGAYVLAPVLSGTMHGPGPGWGHGPRDPDDPNHPTPPDSTGGHCHGPNDPNNPMPPDSSGDHGGWGGPHHGGRH
jgi:hypothetical protein